MKAPKDIHGVGVAMCWTAGTIVAAFLAALAVLGLSMCSEAEADEPSVELLTELMQEAANAVGKPVPDLPAVHLESRKEMNRRCGKCLAQYRPNVVVLWEAIDIDQTIGRSILFHELVHHAQEKTGRFAGLPRCVRKHAREVDAYRAQNDWLERRGSGVRYFSEQQPCA